MNHLKFSPAAFTLFFCLLVFLPQADAQIDSIEHYRKQMEKEFDASSKHFQQRFSAFQDSVDQRFIRHLRRSWKSYEAIAAFQPQTKPKPVDEPVAKPEKVDINTANEMKVAVIDSVQPKPDTSTIKFITDSIQPEKQPEKDIVLEFDFYGTAVKLASDTNFVTRLNTSNISSELIAAFWEQMAETNYWAFIEKLIKQRQQMHLNDWGYYLLVKHAANKITPASENASNLLVWFVLSKSGYKCRIGYKGNRIFVLIPSKNKVYKHNFYVFDNLRYYVVSGNTSSLKIFDSDYETATAIFDFYMAEPMLLNIDIREKKLKFPYKDDNYQITLRYNKNVVDFYADYPIVDVAVYLSAQPTDALKNSLRNELIPVFRNLPDKEAVNILLAFVQHAFQYKTDTEQFGYEKFFFPEEVIHYPYSDCEDRSALFAMLVRHLLNLEVVGVKYPGHIATAVNFRNEERGDFFRHNNKKYIICDPTYKNATVGYCMPKFAKRPAHLIDLFK